MTKKEFLKRWKNSKQNPLMFYRPVETIEKEDWSDALVFDLDVEDYTQPFYMMTIGGYPYSMTAHSESAALTIGGEIPISLNVFYNLRDENNVFITPETHPDLFHDLPWHECDKNDKNKIIKLSKHLVYYEKPYFKIDYGNGTIRESQIQVVCSTDIVSNKSMHSIQGISIYYMDSLASTDYWITNYTENKEYTIKIKGNLTFCYFQYSSRNSIGKLARIKSWGNLHLKNAKHLLYYLFTRTSYMIKDVNTFSMPSILEIDFSKVVSISHMCDCNSYKDFKIFFNYNATELFEQGILEKMPLLVDATNAFYGLGYEYIPRYLFKNNKYLVSIYYFAYDNLAIESPIKKYIGEGAAKDLSYLTDARNAFYFNGINNDFCGIEVIEDSVFENCYNLTSFNEFFYSTFGMGILFKIGNKIFKNCYKLNPERTMIYGYENRYLEEIGDNIFENCYSLEEVSYLGYGAICLKKVGKDIFKGCHSLKKLYDCFRYCFYVGIEFNLGIDSRQPALDLKYTGNLSSVSFYNGSLSLDYIPKSDYPKGTIEYVYDFFRMDNGNTFNPPSIEILKKFAILYPEKMQDLIDRTSKSYKATDFNFIFGPDMFTDECKKSLTSLPNMPNLVYYYNYSLTKDENNNTTSNTFITCAGGVAPDFWNYRLTPPEINPKDYTRGGYYRFKNGVWYGTGIPYYYINTFTNESEIPDDWIMDPSNLVSPYN